MDLSNVPSWIWKTVVGVAAIAGLAVSFFTIQQFFESRLEKEFAAQSAKIITEIHNKSDTLVEFQKDDLWDRIQLLETEIEGRRTESKPVPERMRIHLRSMKERYREMQDPWH